jgi:predicted double-glycine peptidase
LIGRAAARLAAAFLVAAVVGCAQLPANALPVPAVRQQTGYSCGPAALVAVLRYWRKPVACEQDLYSALHTTPKDGTEPWMLASVAQQHGLEARFATGVTVDELRAALAGGATVILDLQAWQDKKRPWASDWDDGHYVVLVAIDGERAYAMDPSSDRGWAWLPVGELVERWHDFEDRDGTRHEFVHAAVFVRGADHARTRVGRPERMQ